MSPPLRISSGMKICFNGSSPARFTCTSTLAYAVVYVTPKFHHQRLISRRQFHTTSLGLLRASSDSGTHHTSAWYMRIRPLFRCIKNAVNHAGIGSPNPSLYTSYFPLPNFFFGNMKHQKKHSPNPSSHNAVASQLLDFCFGGSQQVPQNFVSMLT
jgi:hypothetical protein